MLRVKFHAGHVNISHPFLTVNSDFNQMIPNRQLGCNSAWSYSRADRSTSDVRATAEERHAACKAESAALHRSCAVTRTTKRGTARHATMVPTRLKRSCSWYSRSQLLGPTYPRIPSTSNMMLRTPTVSVGYTVGVAVCKRSLSVTLRLGEQITSHIHRHSNRL